DASVTVCCCVESSAVVDAEDSVTVCCWVESSVVVDDVVPVLELLPPGIVTWATMSSPKTPKWVS
ncbi:hypothetical protein PF008_g33072, partial [Phytophthora fragariae]